MLLNLERYHRPKTLAQALALLKNAQGRVIVPIAGGTRLVASQRRDVQEVVDISRLRLNYIRLTDHGLVIGAMTTLQTLVEAHSLRQSPYHIIAQAAQATTVSKMLRNVASLGGDLVTLSPYSCLATALLALDAVLHVATDTDQGTVLPLAQYFMAGTDRRLPLGIVTEIRVPRHAADTRATFCKLSQIPSSPALINVAALLALSDGVCQTARLAIGAAEPVPIRLTLMEALLEGRSLNTAVIDSVLEKAVEHLQPFSDTHAGADYRKTVAPVLARRALLACMSNDSK
ncbi:MAG: FAD binding domain-containing protein [Acidobacteria bacterium]|nr:FAD binding domain-containing protein [Acidobacteriota bacterium]MBI3656279.1 FAD binding domain-containing protein [Acidobacteriota bacterium]